MNPMTEIPCFNPDTLNKDILTRSYIDDGYALVTDLIAEDGRTEIKTELIKINRGDYPNEAIAPVAGQPGDDELLTRYMYVGEPHVMSPALATYIKHPGLCAILDAVVGAHIPFWDGAYKCLQTMAVSKKPGGNGSPWHQDEHPIPTRDRSLTGVWIALEETTTENGCLWIIPASHKSGIIYERYNHNLPDVDTMTIARGFDDSEAVPVEMKAGSVLFFNGYLLHSSKKNRSAGHRPALTMHYCTASTLLARKEERNYRGVTQVRGDDPYQEEGYTTPQTWAVME